MKGKSQKQIARALGVSPHTVHDYVKRIYVAFGVNSIGELMAYFLREKARRHAAATYVPGQDADLARWRKDV